MPNSFVIVLVEAGPRDWRRGASRRQNVPFVVHVVAVEACDDRHPNRWSEKDLVVVVVVVTMLPPMKAPLGTSATANVPVEQSRDPQNPGD
jgi:hypothetical protein